jgi:hypothetical protein
MTRRPHDFYPTCQLFTAELLARIPEIGGSILEPCSGEHDMTAVLIEHDKLTQIMTNDVDPEKTADLHLDAKDPALYAGQSFDWVITNPPFSSAFEILQQAHAHAKKGVAFLCRLSFIEPTLERGPWFIQNPPNLQIVLPRYSFTQDGKTDSVTCAWFIWFKEPPQGKYPPISFVPRIPRARRRKSK